MVDYIVYYKTNEIESDRIITLEQYVGNTELLEELLIEELKEYLEVEEVELISYESLIDYEADVENIE